MDNWGELEERLGYKFANADLLRTALTHSSRLNEDDRGGDDNQRLEYLGDAIVDLVVAEGLFRGFPEAREGDLTRWRSQLVSTAGLAAAAERLELGRWLLLGRGEEATGGRRKAANLAAAFEAVMAAVYLDSNWTTVQRVISQQLQPFVQATTSVAGPVDSRSRLQEEVQARTGLTPRYQDVGEAGPNHMRRFEVAVLVGEDVWGTGHGPSKRAAAQAAAEQALQRLWS